MPIQYLKILEDMGIHSNSNIIIWGAGAHGEQNLYLLYRLNIPVLGFCDSNTIKQNQMICNKRCFRPEDLDNIDNLVIVFSPKNCEDFFRKLCAIYPKVIDGKELSIFNSMPCGYNDFFPIGHFYSLYPDLEYVSKNEQKIFDKKKEVIDINFCEERQVALLKQMFQLYKTLPDWLHYGDDRETRYRYRYLNPSFSPGDSVNLHCMLRLIQPKRIIEVGSGWSSAVTLDTNEYYFDSNIDLTFIEPYPALLESILKETDQIREIPSGLQDVPLEVFAKLEENDIFFIDSTHVSKIGSDVNYLFFEIFPKLNKGVYIHLHDIFYPFEYPKEWIQNGMVWNELYILRAFLMNNADYEIIYFQNMMEQKYADIAMESWPLEFPFHGGSIWIKKIR